jgi:alkylhydroperoxidase family enzyme
MMRLLFAGCATLMLSATAVAADQTFTPRLQTPRVAPLDKNSGTPAQQAMLASRPDFNIYKTLAHHVDLYNRWSPLGQFVLNGSSLPPREREIVMLRMGWLCQSEYEWAQHARIGKAQAGLSNDDVHRIAEGPAAASSQSGPGPRRAAAARSGRADVAVHNANESGHQAGRTSTGAAVSRLTSQIAMPERRKPGTSSYSSKIPPLPCSQKITVKPPTSMPASAPCRVMAGQ